MSASNPEATLNVGGASIRLLGTIAGFVPDARRVEQAFETFGPSKVGLGIPPEDLQALADLASRPELASELPELDEVEVRFHHWLERFGAVQIPSPELAVAQAEATKSKLPIAALDLDDEAHSLAYTSRMKVRHLVRSASRRRKALTADLSKTSDPYQLAAAWEELLAVKPLRALEADREKHMADALRELAKGGGRVLAIVPATRLAGIVSNLQS